MGDEVSSGSSHDAFELMYRTHRGALLAYFIRRTGDPNCAADLLADVFLVAWRRREKLPALDEQRLWLFGVARNTLLSHRRRRHRDARLGEKLVNALTTVQGQIPRDDGDERVLVALNSLSVRDRELLTLAIWERLNTEEIAALVGLKPTAARVALHRARQRLREALVALNVGATVATK